MYIIQYSNGAYWCNYNRVDSQIRKAMIYNSLKICKSVAQEAGERMISLGRLPEGTTFKILQIDIEVVGEIDLDSIK